jgi:hypothetical protein
MSELPEDPSFDWPSRLAPGDVVRLRDGAVAVVAAVSNYSPDPSRPRYEIVVARVDRHGALDHEIHEPWRCVPGDPADVVLARDLGLLPGDRES